MLKISHIDSVDPVVNLGILFPAPRTLELALTVWTEGLSSIIFDNDYFDGTLFLVFIFNQRSTLQRRKLNKFPMTDGRTRRPIIDFPSQINQDNGFAAGFRWKISDRR